MVGIYDVSTGRLVSVGTEPETLPEGLAVAPFPNGGEYAVTHVWDSELRSWVSAPVQEVTRLTAGDFMRRLGFEREVALRMVMRDPTTPLVLGAQLDTLSAWIDRIVNSGVDLDDPLVAQGVALMASVLDSVGQLPEGVSAFTANMMSRTP